MTKQQVSNLVFKYSVKNGKYEGSFYDTGVMTKEIAKAGHGVAALPKDVLTNTITGETLQEMKDKAEALVERFRLIYKIHSVKFNIEFNQFV